MLGSWPTFRSPKGLLAPIELGQLPFVPKRVFYVCGVPKGQERGNHAHYTTKQILTCIQGEIIVKQLQERLPGYAVPKFVMEIPGAKSKVPCEMAQQDE